ncbi:hypothetical protein EAG_10138 [Camponotus floridanus]|uniref:Uncharacterized protein n=1 Tax=Camponotus floridanus TaxID=104421 RepID=E2AS26_CAMFO|nr:hypothetical protein EAG_10138 [Camponotus floridanus]
MSAASWGTLSEEQARRHCSINNTQPNRSQHILFTSSTHFMSPLCAFFLRHNRRKSGTGTELTSQRHAPPGCQLVKNADRCPYAFDFVAAGFYLGAASPVEQLATDMTK